MNWNYTFTGTVVSTVECPDGTVDIGVVNMDSYTDGDGVEQKKQILFFVNSGRVDLDNLPTLEKGARIGVEGYFTGEHYVRNEAHPEWVSVNGPQVYYAEDGSPYTALEGVAVDIKIIAPPIDFDDYKEQNDILTVLLIGVLGRDAELRYTESGRLLCQTSIRTKRFQYIDLGGDERERQEISTWWRITIWGDAAERASQWWVKDKELIVKVRPRVENNGAPRIWTDKNGDERSSYEANVLWWTFTPGKRTSSPVRDSEYVAPQNEYDDDIPF